MEDYSIMKKIFAVSAAAIAAMALVPTAVSFAAEETVKVNFSITGTDLTGWHYYDFSPNVDGADFTALTVNGSTATFSVDIAPEEVATYGVVLVDNNAWGGTQSVDVKITGVEAAAGDEINVTVTLGEANDEGKLTATVSAAKAAPSSTTPDTTTTPDNDTNTDTGVEGVAAVVGVAAVAAGAMIVAKKRK